MRISYLLSACIKIRKTNTKNFLIFVFIKTEMLSLIIKKGFFQVFLRVIFCFEEQKIVSRRHTEFIKNYLFAQLTYLPLINHTQHQSVVGGT